MNETSSSTIRGIQVQHVPHVGGGWGHSVGSDYYGGTITYVSPDQSWFLGDGMCGFAKLDTNSRSCHFGEYVHAELHQDKIPELCKALGIGGSWDGTHSTLFPLFDQFHRKIFSALKKEPTCHCVRCENTNVRYVCEDPQSNRLDPSF